MLCKIVYFDEDSVTDFVQIVAGGQLEKTTELLNQSQENGKTELGAKVGIGLSGVFRALMGFEGSASVGASIGASFNSNEMAKNIVKNTILTDFIDLVEQYSAEEQTEPEKKIIENFSGYTISAPKDSLSYIALISPYLSMLKSGSSVPAVVLMLYGPSGVGKTESAKSISRSLGGELLRVQFSMMQTEEAHNYVFGAGHAKSSLAKDMLGRESNVILIDEFDKVNPIFYNAFYELFDEGKYVDSNYNVDLEDTIFLCTCNFNSEEEIKRILGPAMYSRIGCCIEFEQLEKTQKEIIIRAWYDKVIERLEEDEKKAIEDTDILEWFLKNVDRYDNIRLLKTKLENAIYNELTNKFIIEATE